MDSYSSPYHCHCSKYGTHIGICINWENNKVTGYDCQYPSCQQDCDMLKEFPLNFERHYPKESDF